MRSPERASGVVSHHRRIRAAAPYGVAADRVDLTPLAWARIAAMTAATASPRKAAAWMAGWLAAMVVMAVAGREATRTLHVFQIMEMRSLLGFVLLWPLLHASGGLKAMRTARPRPAGRAQRRPLRRRSSAGSSR